MSGAEYRVEVHGSVGGNLVVGDHNLIVNAAVGSSVSVVQEAQRPKPVRRPSVRVLPRRPETVLGRSGELGTIIAAVAGLSTIQVYGPVGIGKSTLLRQAAYDIADEVDGVVFLSATGVDHLDVPQEIFEACYETSGYRPSQTEMRRLMSAVRVCVIADDLVCAPDELTAILDTAPDATFVISAPERELWGSGQVIALAGLPEDAALALVRREFGRDLSAAEAAGIVAAWRAAGGSPMSLLRAAATLRLAGPAAVVAAPAPDPSVHEPAIGRASVPAPRPATTRGIAPLLGALPVAERDVHALLGYIAPASATVPVIAALAHASNLTHVAAAAERLVESGLAERVGAGYRLAEDLAVPVAERGYRRGIPTLVAALADWLSRPEAVPSDASDHGELIVALIDAATRDGHAADAVRLARLGAPLAALSLRWSVWRDVLTSGQAAAKSIDDREAYAYFTHERGIRLLCLGQLAAAAAVLTTAAGLWHALGLGQAAAAATHAVAIASGGAPPPLAPPAPSGAPSGPPAQQIVPRQTARAARAAQRAVGQANVPVTGGGISTTLMLTLVGVVVAALVVAGIIVVPRLNHHRTVAAPISTPTPTVSLPASPSAPPVVPAPVAIADHTADGFDPSAVLDANPATFWSSPFQDQSKGDDAWIGLDMGGVASWSGMSVLPRGDRVGFPNMFELESSLDGVTWTVIPGMQFGRPRADIPSQPDGSLLFTFEQPVTARFLRVFAIVLSQTGALADTSATGFAMQIAEMSVLG